MKVCGIELKSNYTVLTLIDYSSDDIIDMVYVTVAQVATENRIRAKK